MIANFSILTKAFSINAYHYSDKRHKTAAARQWEESVLEQLRQVEELKVLAQVFKDVGGVFEVEIVVEYPDSVFYNKQGQVSARTFDLTNTEKAWVDLIYKHVMDVDDRFIIKLTSSKRSGIAHIVRTRILLTPHIRS